MSPTISPTIVMGSRFLRISKPSTPTSPTVAQAAITLCTQIILPMAPPIFCRAYDQDGGHTQLVGNGELEYGKQHVGYGIGTGHKGAQGTHKGIHQRPGSLEDAGHGCGHGNGHSNDLLRDYCPIAS